MDSIRCPHCGKKVEISEAIVHQLSKAQVDKARAEEREKTEREQKEKALLENREKDKEMDEMRKKLTRNAEEDKKREEKIREDAKLEAQKETNIELKSLQKQLTDAREAKVKADRANDDLKRKLNSQSQQLQGEIGEIWLEEELRKAFQYDEFNPVPKGVNGADIIQVVRNKFGNIAGSIAWEAKRQKSWSKGWLVKLREDMRKVGASDCVLVTDILPSGIKSYKRLENVWACSYDSAIILADALRLGILNVAIVRAGASHSDENLRKFYETVNSDRFRNAFEARKEIIKTMEEELESDKSSTERKWKRQSDNIEKLKTNHRELRMMLEDHVPALQDQSDKEKPLLEDGDEENTTLL